MFTGVGLLASAYALTRAVYQQRPQFILQAGVAGSLDPNLALGSTVAVESDCIGDLGVVENQIFQDLFRLGLSQQNDSPYREMKLPNPHALPLSLPGVQAVSVNEITTQPERVAYYRDTLGAQIESMEGAALHYVGLMEGIPFLQVRSLSNAIGERDKQAWKLQEAITSLNKELERLIPKIINQ